MVWLAAGLETGPATAGAVSPAKAGAQQDARAQKVIFEKEVKPLLTRYCYPCHGEKKKGGLDLRIYTDEKSVARDQEVFEKVLKNLQGHEMPPENKPQPTLAERELITRWVTDLFFPCDCRNPDPGRVTIRRLNRVEYNNTIRDLVGVNFQPAADFPEDDTGYGFDNIGDALSLSPVLLEKYLTAAEKILDAAIVTGGPTNGPAQHLTDPLEVANSTAPPLPDSHKRIFICPPPHTNQLECARTIIAGFARRAFRRPVPDEEIGRLLKLFQSVAADGGSFENSIKVTLQAVLVSPHFLFRGELQPEPGNPKRIQPIDEFALASRLSYYLWSSMPDDELFRQAERGTLRRNLEAQVKRMLRDPKAGALVENFAGQWLQLRNLDLVLPDAKQFPDFDEDLRRAMRQETEMFFAYILREDRSVLEFIDANYTFANERLARFYGVRAPPGGEFQRVSLKGPRRGGLLTQASILTITSNPTRTSPVKRGKWVLENILGTPPPPPPPNVPELKDDHAAVLSGTLRQRMEQHRADPNCASCHARMDPIGFGFENYDAIGAWRDRDGDFPIDATGKLVSGESFSGAAEFKTVLLKKKRAEFVRCLTGKMLTYALGRGLEYYDDCAVDDITRRLVKNRYRLSALVLEVIRSAPFQSRRGEAARVAQSSP
jgi:hypothetical protein